MLDFRRLAAKHHIQITDARAGWIQMPCPFCGSGGTHQREISAGYLGFNSESGAFHCWRCGKLDFWQALCGILRVDKNGAKRAIAEFITKRERPVRIQKTRLRAIAKPPDTKYMLSAHRKYLIERGYDPEALEMEWGLEGSGALGGGWAWRIIIPIKNATGRVIAYTGRAIGKRSPKYRTTPDAEWLENPAGALYGIDKAKGESVIIVEGPTGVWRFGPGAVATMGIDWKMPQAAALRHFKNRYILFDSGVGENKAAMRAAGLAQTLSLFPGNTEIISGFSTDPGKFTAARAQRIRKQLGFAN